MNLGVSFICCILPVYMAGIMVTWGLKNSVQAVESRFAW